MARTDVTYAYAADITKTERDPETGVLRVYGKATGPDLDLDEQICDETWLKGAMPRWMEWGNVREMHGPAAAGIGTVLDEVGDDWFVGADIIDPTAALKCETKVYKGYSIGIKNARVVKDVKARGGRIVGGEIVEVSLVDRPCNPTAKMSIAKGAGLAEDGASIELEDGHEAEPVFLEPVGEVEPELETELVPAEPSVEDALVPGVEFSGAGYKALRTDWAKAVGADLRKRVKRLVPDLSKASPEEDVVTAGQAIAIIAQLIQSEAEGLAAGNPCEAGQISCLLRAVDALQYFQCLESSEQGQNMDGVTVAVMDLAAEPDAGTITVEPQISDLVKAAVAEATSEISKTHEAELAALRAELVKVSSQPIPGGPVLARPRAVIAEAGERETSLAKAEYYSSMAKSLRNTDPAAAREYERRALALRPQ